MKAKIIQFRRGRKTYKPKHFLIEIPNSDSREKASKFIGKEIIWKSPSGKLIRGKIASPHGNKGLVRAIFERGLPGQSIGEDLELIQ